MDDRFVSAPSSHLLRSESATGPFFHTDQVGAIPVVQFLFLEVLVQTFSIFLRTTDEDLEGKKKNFGEAHGSLDSRYARIRIRCVCVEEIGKGGDSTGTGASFMGSSWGPHTIFLRDSLYLLLYSHNP